MNRSTWSLISGAGLAAALLCGSVAYGQQDTAFSAATETGKPGSEQSTPQSAPLKVCVLDFTTIDIQAQKRFLDRTNQTIEIPTQSTLNDADRKSINGVMQGFVRMIDAWDTSKTNTSNRVAQTQDNDFNRAKALDLYNTVVKGETRPVVIGAEYLTSSLGSHSDVFSCMDSATMAAAMKKLQNAPDFPKDFMRRLARETGATHLIYGTVSDLHTRSTAFKGYGIETKSTVYQVDVTVNVVDLVRQGSAYTRVYTGSYREQETANMKEFDSSKFQTLMKSALEQAAEDLYDVAKPGRKNQISATPMPYNLTVHPTGGFLFKPASADVLIDGIRVAAGGETVSVPVGRHRLEIRAPGYQNKLLEIEITEDATIQTKLEK